MFLRLSKRTVVEIIGFNDVKDAVLTSVFIGLLSRIKTQFDLEPYKLKPRPIKAYLEPWFPAAAALKDLSLLKSSPR